jgi:hypothetical protein
VGDLGFLMPGDSAGLMVDSEEEMFSEVNLHLAAEKQESGCVKLLFPLLTGDVAGVGQRMALECVWRLDRRCKGKPFLH